MIKPENPKRDLGVSLKEKKRKRKERKEVGIVSGNHWAQSAGLTDLDGNQAQ